MPKMGELILVNKEGKFLKKPWCCIGGRVMYYQLSWKGKLATVKSLKADVFSVSPSSHTTHNSSNRSDEGLMLWNSLRWPIYVINSVDNTKLTILVTPLKIRPHCRQSSRLSDPIQWHILISLLQGTNQALGLLWNLISDLKALKENSVKFFLSRICLFDALKITLKTTPKRILTNGIKRPRLKFNPGLALIGLRTTGPRTGPRTAPLSSLLWKKYVIPLTSVFSNRVQILTTPKRYYWCALVLWRKVGFSTYSCLEAVSSFVC